MDQTPQIIGIFECFRAFGLMKVSLKFKSGKPRVFLSQFYWICVWCINIFSLVCMIDWNESSYSLSLNYFMKMMLIVNTACSMCLSFIDSVDKNRCFDKFCENAKEISKSFQNEFNHSVHCIYFVKVLQVVIGFSVMQYVGVVCWCLLGENSFTMNTVDFFEVHALEILLFLSLKYFFCVQIVRFYLVQLKHSFKENVYDSFVDIPYGKKIRTVNDWKVETRKFRALKKIFFMIKEMVDQVNKTMSAIVMFLLLMAVMFLIQLSFKLLLVVGGSEDHNVDCENTARNIFADLQHL